MQILNVLEEMTTLGDSAVFEYLLINGFSRVLLPPAIDAGRRTLRMFGGASSVVEQRTRHEKS